MKLPLVFVIGDSISIQYGPYLEQYIKGHFVYSRKKGLMEANKNLDVPLGANGGDSSMVLEYIEENYKHKEIPSSDLLLINCGLHDIKTDPDSGKKQVEIRMYKKNLLSIIGAAKKLCGKLVWISTTPCDESVHNVRNKEFYRFHKDCVDYNTAAGKIMKNNNIPIIDLYSFTRNIGGPLYCDHVHFNEDVRQKQAAFIAGWLFNEV